MTRDPRNYRVPSFPRFCRLTSLYSAVSVDVPQYTSSPKASHKAYPEPQTSYIPNQSQESRHPSIASHSRSPFMQLDQDFDAEDTDLSQLMNKRMRETKLIKSKLAEQRLATAELESRLNAQTAASEASERVLRTRISELEALEVARQAKAEEELRAVKAQAGEAERKLHDTTNLLNDVRAKTKSGLEDVGNNYAALQAHFEDLKSEYSASQDAVKRLSIELADLREHVAHTVAELDASEHPSRSAETRVLIDELQSDRVNAQQIIDMLRDKLHLLSAQVIEAKERIVELEAAREGKIEQVEIKVEQLTDKLIKKDEENARGVADALVLEGKLAETNEKLAAVSRTLEQREMDLGVNREQKVAWEYETKEMRAKIVSLQSVASENADLKEERMVSYQEKVSLECQVKELSSRLSGLQTTHSEKLALEYEVKQAHARISALEVLESQVVGLREEKVTLECQVKENQSKITALLEKEEELAGVKERKVALEFEVKEMGAKITGLHAKGAGLEAKGAGLEAKIAGLEAELKDSRTNLQKSKDRTHEQDVQIKELRTQLNAVEGVKEQLRASLESAQQFVTKLTAEVQTLTLKEAVLHQKSEELATQIGKLGTEAAAREEEIQRVNTRSSVLQDRFDSQAMTLKLAKEQSGDLQERLLMSETAHATKLESVAGQLNVELAVLQEQNASLQATLIRVREEGAAQQASFLGLSADYENKLAKMEETHAKLVQAETLRATIAEREAMEGKRLVEELGQQVEIGKAELEEVKRKAREAASRESLGMEGEVVVLRVRLEELEGENSRLQNRARNLNKRYKDGDLSDAEKSFVNSLMQMSQSIHEQEVVAKENELRRRDNMITSLQTRIDTLESTLARMLKEKGKEGDQNGKSMVDLSLWMSSSPRSAQKQAEAQSASLHKASQSPKVFVPDTPPPVVKKYGKTSATASRPPSSPPVGSHRSPKSFASLNAEEDEVLTESDDDDKPLAALGKRARSPTTVKADETTRPPRRLRAAASRKVPDGTTVKADETTRPPRRLRAAASRKVPEVETKKPAVEGVKTKQRKRR
ncbi:hypothetical protein FB45DRAFT_891637 [Roridomyces roridus]|uniref:Uncharacterized protein n=1 Tax=Roridomyces roridus TaxID=1738132 RepID=A0AAD7CG81_9AGAR|nr:hypothetical protein FB45DRAFT_891637 [Roridomyces roridus]